jgi:hypothetical protein
VRDGEFFQLDPANVFVITEALTSV